MRLVSGPPGPRVVLDGRPVTVLSSANYLGLADHPRVREAAADAVRRWGASAGAARPGVGTMLIHRRLEEGLAGFLRSQAALLAGSGYLAALAAVASLGARGHDDPRRRARLPGARRRLPARARRDRRLPPR